MVGCSEVNINFNGKLLVHFCTLITGLALLGLVFSILITGLALLPFILYLSQWIEIEIK